MKQTTIETKRYMVNDLKAKLKIKGTIKNITKKYDLIMIEAEESSYNSLKKKETKYEYNQNELLEQLNTQGIIKDLDFVIKKNLPNIFDYLLLTIAKEEVENESS